MSSGTGVRRLLLDTSIVLWWLVDSDELSEEVKAMIDDETEVYVSAATVWEVASKQQLHKLVAEEDLAEAIERSDLQPLPITLRHAGAAGALPLISRDPIDRMLVAQASCERLTLVTRDDRVAAYEGSVSVLRV